MTSRSRKRREVQGDIFDAGISAAKKEAALDDHEDRKHRLLDELRTHLRVIFERRQSYQGAAAFVTADDAAAYIRSKVGYDYVLGPWMGALFKAKGWKFTGKWVASVRASNNGRMNRCWRYEG